MRPRSRRPRVTTDLPNVPSGSERDAARSHLLSAADRLNANDSLPKPFRDAASKRMAALKSVPAGDVREGDVVHVKSVLSDSVKRFHVTKAFGARSDGSQNVDVIDMATGHALALTLDPYKQHQVERH